MLFRNSNQNRKRFNCPIKGCNKSIMNLARHLTSKQHNWSNESAKAAVSQFGLRTQSELYVKPESDTTTICNKKANKNYHKSRLCPVVDCGIVVKRLPRHLLTHHKMPKNESYYNLLKSAGSFSYLSSKVEKSPRSSTRPIIHSQATPKKIVENATLGNIHAQAIHETHISSYITPPRLNRTEQNVTSITPPTVVCSTPEQPLNSSIESDNSTYTPSKDPLIKVTDVKLSEKVEEIFVAFQLYLVGPDGGNRKRSSTEQVCNDVRRMCKVIRATKSFERLFDAMVFRNEYVVKHCENKKPDSIKKWLTSYQNFCDYLLTETISLEYVDSDSILNMKRKVESWKKTYKKASKERKHQRDLDDYAMIVTPGQVSKYEQSEQAVKARNLFALVGSTDHAISQNDYCTMRDHLFCTIHFANGHRSGVTGNVTMEEFRQVKYVDSIYQISVKDHKTYYAYGPAILTLNQEEFGWMSIFVEKVRPKVHPVCQNIFCSWTGHLMKSGQVSQRIHNMWVTAGIFTEKPVKNLSCNIIRKSTSTGLREMKSTNLQEVADLMTHSKKTADEHYYVREKERAATKGSQVIRNFYKGNDLAQHSPKRQWLPAEILLLQEEFMDSIENKKVNLNEVRERVKKMKIDASPKQVYDKVRSLLRFQPTKPASVRCFTILLFNTNTKIRSVFVCVSIGLRVYDLIFILLFVAQTCCTHQTKIGNNNF